MTRQTSPTYRRQSWLGSTNFCTSLVTKVSLVRFGTRNARARLVPLTTMLKTHVPWPTHPRLYLCLWPNMDSSILIVFPRPPNFKLPCRISKSRCLGASEVPWWPYEVTIWSVAILFIRLINRPQEDDVEPVRQWDFWIFKKRSSPDRPSFSALVNWTYPVITVIRLIIS